jgi:hypothetical protein
MMEIGKTVFEVSDGGLLMANPDKQIAGLTF